MGWGGLYLISAFEECVHGMNVRAGYALSLGMSGPLVCAAPCRSYLSERLQQRGLFVRATERETPAIQGQILGAIEGRACIWIRKEGVEEEEEGKEGRKGGGREGGNGRKRSETWLSCSVTAREKRSLER